MSDIKDIYRFFGFELDPAQRELRYREKTVEIEPRAFDLLVYLVANRDRAVDKNELQDAVWPGMIVTETALTRAVMKARKAVGDDASRQVAIKTLHGHGYRFVAEVEPAPTLTDVGSSTIAPVPATATPEITPTPQGDKTGRKIYWPALILLVIVLAGGFAWFSSRLPEAAAAGTRLAVLPLLDRTDNPELSWTPLGLMSYVDNLITSEGSLAVVPAGSVMGLVENLGWEGGLDSSDNEALRNKLTSVYGASHYLAMELVSEGLALRMNYALLGPDGRLREGTMVGDEGTQLAEGVVQAVYGELLLRSRLSEETPLVSADPFNNEAFARGMSLSLEGRCAEAVQFFKVIIEQEPELFAPRFEFAACQRILGENEEAERLLDELVAEQRAIGGTRELAKSLMTIGILYNRTGRLDEALEAYDEALTVATEVSDQELRARILQNQSIVYKDRSDLEHAEELLDLAVLAYQEAGREVMPGHLWSGRANIKFAQNELSDAEGYLELALAAFREVGDRRQEALILNNTGYLRRRQGRLDEAEEYHLRSLEIREEIGDRVGVGRIYGMLGVVYTTRGDYEEAVEAANQALEVARETQDRLFEGTSLAQLGDAQRALGDYESARGNYRAGRDVFADIGDVMRTLQSDLKLARLDYMEERYESARAIAMEVVTVAHEKDIMSPEVQATELLGDIDMDLGDTAHAIEEYRAAMDQVGQTTWTSKINTLSYKLARAYMDLQDLESAAPHVGMLAGDTPNVQSLKTQARYAHLTGDRERSVSLMEEAKDMAGELWADESEAALETYRSE